MSATATRHPVKYFKHLSDEEAEDLERYIEHAAAAAKLPSDVLTDARRKRDSEGRGSLLPAERDAYRAFQRWYSDWATERAGGPEALAAKREADFSARTEAMISLDDGNFEELVLMAGEPILVQFFTSWCGPCHRAAPVMNEVAERGARIGKLDCERAPETAKRFAIRSFPTFVLFQRGGLRGVYRGPRTVEDIESWLNDMSG